jgi:hypothetical protein
MRLFMPFGDEPKPIQIGNFYFPPPCPAFCKPPSLQQIFSHTYLLLPTYSLYLNQPSQNITSFSKSTTSMELWNSGDLCNCVGAVESIGADVESVRTIAHNNIKR